MSRRKNFVYESDNDSSEEEILTKRKLIKPKKKPIYESDNDSFDEELPTKKKFIKSKKKIIYESNDDDSFEEELSSKKKSIKPTDVEYRNDDIRNIIFEDIDDTYAYGKLGIFDVMMMKSNGYINATKLCSTAKKEFYHWSESKNSKNLISALKRSLCKQGDPISIQITTGNNLTRGTYVHIDLIIHIASWCSPEYALLVSKIVREYHAKEAIYEKDKLLQKKDDKIDKLTNKVDTLLDNNKELLGNNKELIDKNDVLLQKNSKMDNRIKRLLKKNDEIYDQNQDIQGKLSIVSNDRVIRNNKSDQHLLLFIKNNDDPEEYAEG